MLAAIRKRLAKDEEGFTLIELMVVVLIIAILIAIAVPTFLGARQKAQARAAQSNVRNAFSAAKVFFTDNETYSTDATTDATSLIAALTANEPSLTYNTAASTTNNRQVGVTSTAWRASRCTARTATTTPCVTSPWAPARA
jgi:type IV pilus assembly protein PilA